MANEHTEPNEQWWDESWPITFGVNAVPAPGGRPASAKTELQNRFGAPENRNGRLHVNRQRREEKVFIALIQTLPDKVAKLVNVKEIRGSLGYLVNVSIEGQGHIQLRLPSGRIPEKVLANVRNQILLIA